MRDTLYETTRLVLLAGIGAISLAQEEIKNFLDRLVERGQMADADARKLLREVMDRRAKLESEHKASSAETPAPAAATRADVEALTARVDELTRQIEELRPKKASK